MQRNDSESKDKLKQHLKDAAGNAFENLFNRISALPYEGVLITTDLGITIAATNLRAAIEFLKAAPDVARLLDAGDLRVWGEAGKRIATTSADAAIDFFQSSASIIGAFPAELRSLLLKLINKQAALSANTALESFQSAPTIIEKIASPALAEKVLSICIEIARHSIKHSNDLLQAAPQIIAQLQTAYHRQSESLVTRALALTANFAYRSGGTAAEFFLELPNVARLSKPEVIESLFHITEEYLERSGGVALQYFKAASQVLKIANEEAFKRWTALAQQVSLQGNAASYHFMKASPQIIAELGARFPPDRRAQVVSAVLEIVEELADKNMTAAIECFKASPLALRASSIGQFRAWALRGLEKAGETTRRLQAYYALESKASQQALFKIEGGLTLDAISQTLRLYVEGLTGRALNIAALGAIPDESKISDGKTIYLPSVVAEFEDEAENFRLFKVLAAHGAGQIEFHTYAQGTEDLLAAFREIRAVFDAKKAAINKGNSPSEEVASLDAQAPNESQQSTLRNAQAANRNRKILKPQSVDFLRVLDEFPNKEIAMRLFTTIENGRIDFLLRKTYRGIRRDLDFVRLRLLERRPHLTDLPPEFVPLELLFQISLCGGATLTARRAYPAVVAQLEEIFAANIFQENATLGDSLIATRHIYELLVEQQANDAAESEPQANAAEAGEMQNDAATDDESTAEATTQEQAEVRQDPFSFWSSNQEQEASPEADVFNSISGGESSEQDLEKGDKAFFYDEWDRELGDHRTRWCRIIERAGTRGSRSFVELTRSRHSGVISSIRYQFQLMRPENLRRIRGEVDGEDYDLQRVIDNTINKRSTGIIDERLYTRKLRREREVAVSFLLDMSSSTARTISRVPNKPYTQPGQRIIDIEKEGLVLMSEALEAVGDNYSMQGFTSEGRRNVKFYVIKDFSEKYSPDVEKRLGGITYQNNTRLGAAIRHAITRLSAQDERTKLLIVLSDGRPYDHDYGDSRYAREDTRMALRQARIEGITPFCITIDRDSEDQLKDMYGEVGYTIIDDVLNLPERLPGIYRRLTT
ncbi:MAG: VWA domain-containing protein [Acidobacteria bacterium]|nr:VWA domain-containing protein [Acidobacteriota bacterium]